MGRLIQSLLRDESGTTALEYAFIAGLVSVGGIVAYEALADSLSNLYIFISSQVQDSM